MIDYHVHTNYTIDAEGNFEDYCKVADQKGVKEMAFTNHFQIIKVGKSGQTINTNDIAKNFEEIDLARPKFDVDIKVGLEVDYWEYEHRKIEEILESHPFDLLLGSAHFIGDYCIAGTLEEAAGLFKSKSMIEIYEAYFDNVIKTVNSQLFDVLAHPDYIRKNLTKYFGRDIPFEDYRKFVEKVVESLVDNNVGIELNSSGYFHGLNDSFPSSEFLKVCFESGVKIFTIGSDAHRPNAVGWHYDEGINKLKNAGVRKVATFEKRKSKLISIEKL